MIYVTFLNNWDLSALRYSFIRVRTWCIPTGSRSVVQNEPKKRWSISVTQEQQTWKRHPREGGHQETCRLVISIPAYLPIIATYSHYLI